MSNHVRGYRGLKLRCAHRTRPGCEFGGRDLQQRVANFMAANPPPLPPIEVSFILPTKAKYFSRFFLTAIAIYYMYHTNQ